MMAGERLMVSGIEIEGVRRGSGRPILALPGFQTIDPDARFLDLLGRYGEVIAPSGPGFGHSPRPKDFDTVYDLVHLYLDLLNALPGDKVTLVGFSFGGWLAAEIAAACSHRLRQAGFLGPPPGKSRDPAPPHIFANFNKMPGQKRRKNIAHPP